MFGTPEHTGPPWPIMVNNVAMYVWGCKWKCDVWIVWSEYIYIYVKSDLNMCINIRINVVLGLPLLLSVMVLTVLCTVYNIRLLFSRSSPGCSAVIRPRGQLNGDTWSSLTMTKSPIRILVGSFVCHLLRTVKWFRESLCHRVQKCWGSVATCLACSAVYIGNVFLRYAG